MEMADFLGAEGCGFRIEIDFGVVRQFPEYDDVEQVFKSCYENTTHPQKMKAETGKIPYATVMKSKTSSTDISNSASTSSPCRTVS